MSPDLDHVIRAFHKEFSLTVNYPKGHGEKFLEWIIKNDPNAFLMHAEQATGSRQDLITMGTGPIYWNRIFNVEFLDDVLWVKEEAMFSRKTYSQFFLCWKWFPDVASFQSFNLQFACRSDG